MQINQYLSLEVEIMGILLEMLCLVAGKEVVKWHRCLSRRQIIWV